MGGGGSVKDIETKGHTYVPKIRGWESVVNHLAVAPSGGARPRLGGWHRCRPGLPLLGDRGRDRPDDDRRPALVDQASLGDVSKEELGHARIHTGNGSIDDVVATEDEAFDRARRFLSYLPSNVDELPPRGPRHDDAERRDEVLASIVPRDPRRVYKMRDLIGSVVDRDSFFEIGRNWGKAIITGLARLDGWPVALFAEDPYIYGGAWTADAARKVTRFIDLASTFHLPLVHLEDCPGFLIGKQSEEEGTIRRLHRPRRAGSVDQPVLCGDHPQGVRRRRGRQLQAGRHPLPLCMALG